MLPESIETAAMARIDALAPADRALVRRASVLGTTFHRRFLAEVLDDEAPAPDDETWERLGEFFVDDDEDYLRFRRAIVRDAAYTGLPFRTRRTLHARVAERFENEFVPEETGGLLSLHFFLAGNYEKAWPYAEMAARRAAEQFDTKRPPNSTNVRLTRGSIFRNLVERDLATVYEAVGNARYRASEYRKAAAAFSSAAKRTKDDPVALGRILERRAWIDEALGKYPQALRWVRRGLKDLEGVVGIEASGQRSRLLQFYATVLLAEGRPAQALPWADQAVAEATEAGDRVALASAYDFIHRSNLSLGRPAGEYWRLALAIFEELGDIGRASGILLNLGAGLFYEGRWEEALEAYERARIGRCRSATR